MATQGPALSTPLGDFAAQLLAERELLPRAQVIAEAVSERLPGAAVNVYLYDENELPPWSVKAAIGELSARASATARSTLTLVAKRRESLLFAGAKLAREHYAHLDVRRTVVSLAYVPILLDEILLGAIEVVTFDRALEPGDLDQIEELTEFSALALASALTYENERNTNLDSITRLTQLYDVERVFNSNLDMGELLPIIAAKIRELIPVQAVNLWMVEEDAVVLISRDGQDPTLAVGAGEDEIIHQVSDSGKSLVINDSADPRLMKRNGEVQQGAIRYVMACPIVHENALVGVLECVNKDDGTKFDEDDLFFLGMMAQTAATSLHNASLLEAERKIEILETLVEVSQEITSTLNLERVLQVIVNAPQRIIQYDRAAVALEDRGKLQVKAISGKTEVLSTDPSVKPLKEMLEWAIAVDAEVFVTVKDGTVQADREETRAKFLEYFKSAGSRAWYSVPLADEQGRLGILSFESRNADFLSDALLELIKVLAAQATVALRNASLYTEVPFISVLEPVLQKKAQFLRLEKRRRATYVALAVAAVLFLLFFPLPMRVSGPATVAPQSSSQLQAEADGVIKAVYVREGDRVARGTVLGEMDDWDYRGAVAAAQANYETAMSAMNKALAANDGAEAGTQRIRANYWSTEVTRAKERLEHLKFRSPIEGLVATPHIETLVGKKLSAGDPFAQVVNTAHATVDVAMSESDVPLLEAGEKAAVKVEGFPTRRFAGKVEVVSPTSATDQDRRVYFARVDVANPEGLLRPGMLGYSKVSVGWKPAGYVLFRDIGMWAWTKLWKWFG